MNVLRFIIKILLLVLLVAFQQGLGSELLRSFITSSSFIDSLLSFLVFWITVNLVIRVSQFIYRKKKKLGHKYSDNVINGLQNIYYLVTALGVLVMVLGFFGMKPFELLTALSIVAAAIAIISKELVTDVICGINISFSRELALGDYVRIGEVKGKVMDINIHKIVLQNDEDDIIHIPNTKAYYSDIVNFTQKEIRKYNLDFSLPASKPILKENLQQDIFGVLDQYDAHCEKSARWFRMIGLTKDEVRYKLQFKLNKINPALEQEIKTKILETVHQRILDTPT